MNTIQFLEQMGTLYKQIKANQAEREVIANSLLGASGIDYTGVKVQKTPENIQEKLIASMIDLEEKILADVSSLLEKQNDIRSLLKNVDNIEYRTLLQYKYLTYKTWEEIADLTYCSRSNIFNKRKKALKAFEKANKNTLKENNVKTIFIK